MDDLNQQINQILSDPQSMQQIQNIMSALGMNGTQPAGGSSAPPEPAPAKVPPPAQNPPQNTGLDPSALLGMLGSLNGGTGGQAQPSSGTGNSLGGVTPEMLQMVTRMGPLLSQVNREDDSTRLLHALRPLLSQPRQQKLDEAIKILHMMRLLPLLKESGLFSGLLSGLL